MEGQKSPPTPPEEPEWLRAFVKTYVMADLADLVRTGELVIVRDPDGTLVYRLAATMH